MKFFLAISLSRGKRSKIKMKKKAKFLTSSDSKQPRLRFISDDFAYKHHIAVVNPPSINLLQSHKSNIINP